MKVPKGYKRKGYSIGGEIAGYDDRGRAIDSSGNIITDSYGQPITRENISSNTLQSQQGGEFQSKGSSSFYDNFSDNSSAIGGGISQGVNSFQGNYVGKNSNMSDGDRKAANSKAAQNAAGEALGAVGSSYFASQQAQGKGNTVYNSGMGTVSKIGPIGGAIGGIAAFGNMIGDPIKQNAERTNSDGTFTDKKAAKRNAQIGAFVDPFRGMTETWSNENSSTAEKIGSVFLPGVSAKAYRDNLDNQEIANVIKVNEEKKRKQQELAKEGIQNREAGILASDKTNKIYEATYANGGEIKGKGTPKSDSINAEIKDGSFVVPNENLHIAKMLKAAVLGKNPNTKAKLHQKNGTPVKLSDEEYLFTKSEVSELEEKGVDVDALAPNAEGGDNFREGGEKDDDFVAAEKKKLAEKKAKEAKAKSDQEARLKADEAARNKRASAYEVGEKKKKVRTELYKDWKAKQNKYNSLKDISYKLAGNDAEREDVLNKINAAKKEFDEADNRLKFVNDDKNWNDDGTFKTKSASVNTQSAKQPASGIPNVMAKPSFNQFKGGATKPSTNQNSKTVSSGTKKPNNSALAKALGFAPSMADDTGDYPMVPGTQQTPLAPGTKTNDLTDAQAKELNQSAQKYQKEHPQIESSGDDNRGGKLQNLFKNFNMPSGLVDMGFGAWQLKKGLEATNEQRPIDKIDPTFDANVNLAQANAKFGFTNDEKFALDQKNQALLNDARFAARNYSGGNAGAAFNMERTAINDAVMSNLQNSIADNQVKQNKQEYATSLSAQRAGMSRQLFNDAMNAFNAKQQAGAALAGAGIKNIVGGARLANESLNQNQYDYYNNSWINNI
jgi:hypothetical protein